MSFRVLPVLETVREIYAIPRGRPRFDAYLARMCEADGNLRLPLTALNPMAKEPTVAVLDALLALGAEDVARETLRRTEARLPREAADVDLGVVLVLADDLAGGWTNRAFADSMYRFPENTHTLRRNWAVALLFSSDAPTREGVETTVDAAVRRTLFQLRFGLPDTVNDRLRQEGVAQRFAGIRQILDAPALAAVGATLGPHRASRVEPVRFAAMYGDEAARECGYAPLGVPPNGGFALALAEAQSADER